MSKYIALILLGWLSILIKSDPLFYITICLGCLILGFDWENFKQALAMNPRLPGTKKRIQHIENSSESMLFEKNDFLSRIREDFLLEVENDIWVVYYFTNPQNYSLFTLSKTYADEFALRNEDYVVVRFSEFLQNLAEDAYNRGYAESSYEEGLTNGS